ncbi:MAG TPA: sigma-70 family RNA polymerase sigma factor [Polyangiales bacterium]|nr:sigma-70 family RNA polymerase sigma factor [Polyangiales bacterium]
MSSEAQRAARAVRERAHAQEDTLAARFSELYEQHFDFVWRSARYLGEPDASLDDAVQDVFLVAYRRFQDFEARSSPRTWLFAITMRVISDHRRSRRRKGRLLDSVTRMFTQPVSTPYDHTAHAEDGRALLAALEGLSEEQRATFVMADLEELSAPEIAEVLSVNVNTVYSRLRSARRAVSRRLSGEP